jgi:acyl carrier protein
MDTNEAQLLVLAVLEEIQKSSGRAFSEVAPDDEPIGALDGFDSLTGIEATVMIEEKLGCNLDLESIFVSQDGRRALTLEQIAKRVAKLSRTKGGKR